MLREEITISGTRTCANAYFASVVTQYIEKPRWAQNWSQWKKSAILDRP
jgi:hypothetical protein